MNGRTGGRCAIRTRATFRWCGLASRCLRPLGQSSGETGADAGNRTLVIGLEGLSSTIELQTHCGARDRPGLNRVETGAAYCHPAVSSVALASGLTQVRRIRVPGTASGAGLARGLAAAPGCWFSTMSWSAYFMAHLLGGRVVRPTCSISVVAVRLAILRQQMPTQGATDFVRGRRRVQRLVSARFEPLADGFLGGLRRLRHGRAVSGGTYSGHHLRLATLDRRAPARDVSLAHRAPIRDSLQHPAEPEARQHNVCYPYYAARLERFSRCHEGSLCGYSPVHTRRNHACAAFANSRGHDHGA